MVGVSPAKDDLPMVRFLFRLLGLVALATGFIFVVYDGMKTIADQGLFISRFGDVWNAVHGASQQALQGWVIAHGAPWVWDPGMVKVLAAPMWLVLLIVGGILLLLGRRKRPLIGYARS